MDVRPILTGMLLLIIGVVMLFQNYPAEWAFLKYIALIPAGVGFLIMGLAVKQEIIR